MAFNLRESFWGLEHLRLRLWRQLFKVPSRHFISKYSDTGIRVRQSASEGSAEKNCERCGFALVEADFDGWQLEMCSALPPAHLDSPKFKQWLHSLANRDCQLHHPEPILHE